MIQSISLRNIKGFTGKLELSGRDILVGPNGTGKTAIEEAIQFVLTGYTALGKKPSSMLALGDGDSLEATAGDEAGNYLTRRIIKGKTVSTELILNGEPLKDEAAIPPAFRFPAEVIHPAEFLALSGEKRAAWLFQAMGKSSKGVDVLNPDQVPGKWPWLKEPMSAGEILEKLTEEHATSKKELERCKANLQRLTGSENQLPTGTQREWEEKLAKIDADLSKATKDQAAAEERARLSSSRHLLRQEAEENIRKADAKIQKTEELIAHLSSIANSPRRGIVVDLPEIKAKIESAKTRKTLATERASVLRKQAQEIESHGKCPACGTSGKTIDSVLSAWDQQATKVEMEAEDLTDEIVALELDLKEIETAEQVNRGIDLAKTQLPVERDALASYRKSREKFEDDMLRLNQTGAEDSGDPAVISAQVEGLLSQQKEARAALKRHHESTSIKSERAKAQDDLTALNGKLDEIKKAGTEVKRLRNAILEDLTKGLMEPFDKAVGQCFGTKPYFRILDAKGKPEVDFGIILKDREISFDTLSGGERLVVLVALVAALQVAKGGQPRLCMIEMAEADATRLNAVMGTCGNIGFEQVILATCQWPRVPGENAYFPPPKGWNLVDMEKEARA